MLELLSCDLIIGIWQLCLLVFYLLKICKTEIFNDIKSLAVYIKNLLRYKECLI